MVVHELLHLEWQELVLDALLFAFEIVVLSRSEGSIVGSEELSEVTQKVFVNACVVETT